MSIFIGGVVVLDSKKNKTSITLEACIIRRSHRPHFAQTEQQSYSIPNLLSSSLLFLSIYSERVLCEEFTRFKIPSTLDS